MKQHPRQAFLEKGLRRIAIAVFTGYVGVCAYPVSSHAQTIRIEATTTAMDWNAVALAGGHVFVAGSSLERVFRTGRGSSDKEWKDGAFSGC
ncbi:hypothetical protein [Gluconobacter wancherniae]|uniref:hypothetical protein n=1 Tax=Gluconobacter wancherniae TaxID=1307955 RepID=UPI002012E660|nr:hypothetical protein [Gluconobacter wancherniae]